MQMTTPQIFITVAAMVLGTMLTRALPFFVFGKNKPTPRYVAYLGQVLPCAMMAFLVVYCLKGASIFAAPHGLPELISLAVVVGLHAWKKNVLLSITAGTALYMVLVQAVF